jgi:hypothetical protein
MAIRTFRIELNGTQRHRLGLGGRRFDDEPRRFDGAAEDRPIVLRENYDGYGVPTFNTDHVQTLASIERVKKVAANLKATVIIQRDPRDIGKLPVF